MLLLGFLIALAIPVIAGFIDIPNFAGGLNNRYISSIIADNEASDIQNINLSVNVGAITKRTGYAVICPSAITSPSSFEINGLFDYKQSDGDQYLIACSTNSITKLNTAATGWDVLCSTSSIASGGYYNFCNFDNTLIINDGASVPKKYIGGTATIDIGTGTDPNDWRPNYCQYAEKFQNRLWVSGKIQEANGGVAGDEKYNRVRYTGYYDYPYTFEGVGAWPPLWYFDIDDEKVTGLRNFNGELIVFGLNTVNKIQGQMYASDNGYTLNKIISGIGCISERTIVLMDNELYFMDKSGDIYSYNGANFTLKSAKISTTINGLNKTKLSKSVARYYPKYHQLWIAVPYGSSTTNDLIMVYDTLLQAWTIYKGINASALELVNNSNSLYLYSGDASTGYVYKQDTGNTDYLSNTATAIDAYYITKDYSGMAKEQEVIFDSIYLTFIQTGDYNLTVGINIDYTSTTSSQLVNLNPGTSLWDSFIWDVDKWAGSETIKTNKLSLNEAGNFINLKFSNNNDAQPFTIYSAKIRFTPLELR